MKCKKSLGTILTVLGAALFAFGSYLSNEAAYEKGRITQAEATGEGRPTLGPVRRAVKNQEAINKQQRLGQAVQQMVSSQISANWLRGVRSEERRVGKEGRS